MENEITEKIIGAAIEMHRQLVLILRDGLKRVANNYEDSQRLSASAPKTSASASIGGLS